MNQYQQVCENLSPRPKTWLVTGVGGFIGLNLLETLLKLNQTVVGLVTLPQVISTILMKYKVW